MTKKPYRTEIGIVGDILGVTANGGVGGVLVSQITRSANLSHYVALTKCDKLVDAGLVQYNRSGRCKVFMITDKGREFVRELEKFRDLTEKLNLRY